jgi:uncharacterized protein (DUF486 family)
LICARTHADSWLIAGGEYCLQVPANRIGASSGLSAAQLRAIAELAILASFLVFNGAARHNPTHATRHR